MLVWVQKNDEAELRNAFQRTRNVRRAGGEAKELADLYFSRRWCACIAPARAPRTPGSNPRARSSLRSPPPTKRSRTASSKASPKIFERTETGLHRQFDQVMAKKKYNPNDVAAGRAYASAYVEFMHYAERLYEAAETMAPEYVEKARGPRLTPIGKGRIMKFEIPKPLRAEHQELHARPYERPRSPARSARRRARWLACSIRTVREEAFALPPLALLSELSRGGVTADMAAVLPTTRRLKAELPTMLAEHRQIVDTSRRCAPPRVRPGFPSTSAAEALVLHAQTEELVLYPADPDRRARRAQLERSGRGPLGR